MAPFVVEGGFVVKGGVASVGVVPALNEVEDGQAGLDLGRPQNRPQFLGGPSYQQDL